MVNKTNVIIGVAAALSIFAAAASLKQGVDLAVMRNELLAQRADVVRLASPAQSTATTTTAQEPQWFSAGPWMFQVRHPGWVVEGRSNTSVRIRTASEPYDVFMALSIEPATDPKTGKPLQPAKSYNEIFSAQGMIVYSDTCAPGIACYVVTLADGTEPHEFFWNVEGNEPAPKVMDGVWSPTPNFTADDILDIMRTGSREGAD